MAARVRATQPALAPFSAPRDAADAPAASDSGAASFLGQARACLAMIPPP